MRTELVLAPLLLCPLALWAAPPPPPVEPEAQEPISAYLAAIAEVEDMTYRLVKTERLRDGDVIRETLRVKLRVDPYAVYLARVLPEEGMEAIYRAGQNDDEMTGHQGSFPDVTLDLDPEGGTAMDDQHHPIYATGLAGVTRRLELAVALSARGEVSIRRVDDQVVGGITTICIEIDASRARGRTVRAREDETLFQLAERVGSWPYVLYQHNPDVDDIDDELDEGDSIFVPAFYAERTEFCFDPETHLVIRESYYDDDGLYERYDTLERRTNVGLRNRDFDPDNDDYDF